MPIDASVPRSDGWYVMRMQRMLRTHLPRLNRLISYRDGRPPLPEGATDQQQAYQAFQQKARSNFAELVGEATRDRMQVTGFRTALADDATGDQAAWAMWRQLGLPVKSGDALGDMLHLGKGYMIAGWDNDRNCPVATAEDPRTMVVIHDPLDSRRVIAAMKFYTDPELVRDVIYLYLPGRVRTAVRGQATTVVGRTAAFTPSDWDWVDELPDNDPMFGLIDPGGDLSGKIGDRVPVVPFVNRQAIGEFENHLDLLDRINHGILQRMVIVATQAYRQRVFIGDFRPVDPVTGATIDYGQLFKGSPGAAWTFPTGTDVKEFTQADVSGILNAVKDDVLHLASVTRTPLHMFTPDAVSQSAEGAQLQREGLVFKVEDRIARASDGFAQLMSLLFLFSGDQTRGQVEQMVPMWAPVERYSLAEQGSAWSQMAGLPFAARARIVLQANPAEIAEMESERATEALLAPALAAVQSVAEDRSPAAALANAIAPAAVPPPSAVPTTASPPAR